MKKYSKPQITIENFLLTENIASCGTAVFDTVNGGCQNNFDVLDQLKDSGVFTTGCKFVAKDGEQWEYNNEKLCLHTSTGTSVFSS